MDVIVRDLRWRVDGAAGSTSSGVGSAVLIGAVLERNATAVLLCKRGGAVVFVLCVSIGFVVGVYLRIRGDRGSMRRASGGCLGAWRR